MVVTGEVTDVRSHWTDDGSRIVTEATVHGVDGDVVVSQLGGTVDGLAMQTFPGPPVLALGMRVAVGAHRDVDLDRAEFVVVDSVKVMADPAGFVRTGPTKAGNSLYWESGCVFVTVDSAGTKAIADDQEFAVIDTSVATWNDDTASCSYLRVNIDGKRATEVGKDYINVIKFRDVSWCRPALHGDPARCYDESAAGITTATFFNDGSARDGAIVDADIELNNVNFAISVDGVTQKPMAGCKADLQNTLTHELGHLHGLEHTCLADRDPPRVDDQGNPVPRCLSTTDPKIVDATMYNFQDCDETKKRTLEADDIAAICAIYPTADDPKTCAPVDDPTGCCSTGGAPAGPLLLAAGTAALLVRRRKKLAR
jgi:MYXO-CTERM domain-containing protein